MKTRKLIAIFFIINLNLFLSASNFEKYFENKYWVREYYNEVIQKQNRNVFFQYVPNFKENPSTFYYHLDDEIFWYEELDRLGDDFELFYSDYTKTNCIDILRTPLEILEIKKLKENYYIITTEELKIDSFFVDEWLKDGCDWSLLLNKTNDKYYIKFDGDYVNIYVDEGKQLLVTYCALDEQEYRAFLEAVKCNKFNDFKYTYPRHADGTCDYEDVSSVKTVSSPTTNVAPNKTMTVSENLKLRSAEATTSEVITVMSAGTRVKILELGKAESIDGINSNWVKVEVQSGAKDREGNTISKDTVGWCYGGYLAETTEANNFESTDTKEISDIKIEEAPKQEINIGIVCAIIGAVLLLLLLILIFGVRKKKDNP